MNFSSDLELFKCLAAIANITKRIATETYIFGIEIQVGIDVLRKRYNLLTCKRKTFENKDGRYCNLIADYKYFV